MQELTIRCVVEQRGAHLEYVVRSDNRDRVAWDMTRARKSWPADPREAMSLYMTFLTWSALHREQQTDLKLDEFMQSCVAVQPVKADGSELTEDDAGADVDPTRPDHVSG